MPCSRHKDGNTPLSLAAEFDHKETCALLRSKINWFKWMQQQQQVETPGMYSPPQMAQPLAQQPLQQQGMPQPDQAVMQQQNIQMQPMQIGQQPPVPAIDAAKDVHEANIAWAGLGAGWFCCCFFSLLLLVIPHCTKLSMTFDLFYGACRQAGQGLCWVGVIRFMRLGPERNNYTNTRTAATVAGINGVVCLAYFCLWIIPMVVSWNVRAESMEQARDLLNCE